MTEKIFKIVKKVRECLPNSKIFAQMVRSENQKVQFDWPPKWHVW